MTTIIGILLGGILLVIAYWLDRMAEEWYKKHEGD